MDPRYYQSPGQRQPHAPAYQDGYTKQSPYGYEAENLPPRAPAAPIAPFPPAQSESQQDTQQYSYPASDAFDEEINGPHVGGLLMPLAQDGTQEQIVVMTRDQLSLDSGGRGFTIGRHPACDYIVEGTAVSSRHCRFAFNPYRPPHSRDQAETIILEDLSTNGTLVNDETIGKGKSKILSDGDSVSITNAARFIFQLPARRRQETEFEKHYTLFKPLGSGTFATVYYARDKANGRPFAVKKFVHQGVVDMKTQMKGISQEIAVLKAVSHPNLLCMIDSFAENDGFYLVLDYAPGGDLFKYVVKNKKLSERRSRSVLVQLCSALKYLHDRRIIHRDIKLENILLMDAEPTIKLADFGLAKIIGENSFTTTLCGTPDYVAPEVINPSIPRRYTQAVDLWSVGVVLYVCLCGFPPFSEQLYNRANNPYHLSDQIIMGRYHFPSPYWDVIDDSALELITSLLCVDPEERINVDECLAHPWVTLTRRPVSGTTVGGLPPQQHHQHAQNHQHYYGDRGAHFAAAPRGHRDYALYLNESQRKRTFEMDREYMSAAAARHRAPQAQGGGRGLGGYPSGYGFGEDELLYSYD